MSKQSAVREQRPTKGSEGCRVNTGKKRGQRAEETRVGEKSEGIRGDRETYGTERRRGGKGPERRYLALEEIKGLEGQRAVAGHRALEGTEDRIGDRGL
jgi:hypothetical protein